MRTTSPSPTSSGAGAETFEGAVTCGSTDVLPALARVGGRGAGAGSLPIKVGGPSCDWVAPCDCAVPCGWAVPCDWEPTRRNRVRDADPPSGGAESRDGCPVVVRGSLFALAGSADFLADCAEVPLGW